jgi:hypothetical protein
VVEDNPILVSLPCCIGTIVNVSLLSATEADEAYYHVAAGTHGVVSHRDTGVGRCLTLYRGVVADLQLLVQGYHAGHIKDYYLSLILVDRFNGIA